MVDLVTNATWLRHDALSASAVCLDAWQQQGYKRRGVKIAVTEANAGTSGPTGEGPTPASFAHGFFSVAELGQFARLGVTTVARWALTNSNGGNWASGLLNFHVPLTSTTAARAEPGATATATSVEASADFSLCVLFNDTVGRV